ncbi:MAG: L-threonylcarbamoyladenylate synthase [Acutalibacteraceae bacterium]|nr:L-threonylcarbamoyladenylate synthase [Acutalibacteraceae bacterium]
METKVLSPDKNSLKLAGDLLKNGELVGIPTETVYGLAANALDGKAVEKIFKAKGRPMDNPLIVHISDISQVESLVKDFSEKAQALAKVFWPGPLTIIMPCSDNVPNQVTAGLDTVAIRFPSHKTARDIINCAGVPLAAPSANLSGSPSPTTAMHVYNDLKDRIPLIIDGGESNVGLESTVLSVAGEVPVLLRPGGITVEQIEAVIGKINIDKGVTEMLDADAVVASPGMKYKHYAPKAHIVILKADTDEYINYINTHKDEKTGALCYNSDIKLLNVPYISLGEENDYNSQAHNLFNSLRQLDEMGLKTVYARCPSTEGVGLAVYNRLIRSAGFEVIDLA